ncbi:MAG: phosphodiester glycosidase family protein [Oscillospiraceae bacterium]|nr:phosphodiester glycosidase family protein [Oscillospiraceae bacterium]
MMKRGIAVFLCFFILAGFFPGMAAEYGFTGGGHTFYRSHTYTPAVLTQYTVNTLRHSGAGLNEEHILSFTPNAGLRPIVVSSDHIYQGGMTLEQAAEQAASRLGADVVAGMNASFFNSNMTTIGLQVRQGVLSSYSREGGHLPSVGFTASGDVLLGEPGYSVTVTGAAGTVVVDRLNYQRTPERVHMYTRDFSATTGTTLQGMHVVMRVSDRLRPGGALTGTVTRVLTGTEAHAIADDEIVLSASSQATIDRISFLTEGSWVVISADCADPRWNGINAAAVGLRYLVREGQSTGASDGARAPRTVIGMRDDGSVVFYTVDGRQSGYSAGLTLNEAAARMIDMGCVTAIEMDGGGSTAMMVRLPGEASAELVNRPSDGRLRRSADFILLCNVFPASDGSATRLFPTPAYVTMMPDTPVSFTLRAADEFYRPVAGPYGPITSVSADPGVGRSDGLSFQALSPGDTTVAFHTANASGTARIHVTARLDSLSLTLAETGLALTEMFASPGQSIRLAADGRLNNAPVLSTPLSFVWAVEGDIGSVSPEGVFTAASQAGKTGRITVSGGGLTASLNVSVGVAEPIIIEDFENGLGRLSAGAGGLTASVTSDINLAERGMSAAALTYAFSQEAPAEQTIGLSAQTSGSPPYLHLLVTGDSSGHTLAVNVTANGAARQVPLGRLDFTGTRMLTAELPPQTSAVTGLTLTPAAGGRSSGAVYLHQVVAAWESALGGEPPSIDIEGPREAGNELVYTVSAADWKGQRPKELVVKWNGEVIPSPAWDAGRAEIRVPKPESGLHILSADATDALGRRARQISSDFYGRRDSPFTIWDAADKWYTGFVDFLDDRDVLDADEVLGLRYYRPEQSATRLEVARMLARILSLPPGPAALPFDDTASLGADDAAAVAAVYGAGLFSGKVRSGGTLYFDCDGLITRAELFTVLNKTFPRGYERDGLYRFTDTAEIPPFALRATQTLVGMGVVSGSGDGRVMPNAPISRAEVCSLFTRLFY